jgi:hypothetical protein
LHLIALRNTWDGTDLLKRHDKGLTMARRYGRCGIGADQLDFDGLPDGTE